MKTGHEAMVDMAWCSRFPFSPLAARHERKSKRLEESIDTQLRYAPTDKDAWCEVDVKLLEEDGELKVLGRHACSKLHQPAGRVAS
jgi:hypothetical protein